MVLTKMINYNFLNVFGNRCSFVETDELNRKIKSRKCHTFLDLNNKLNLSTLKIINYNNNGYHLIDFKEPQNLCKDSKGDTNYRNLYIWYKDESLSEKFFIKELSQSLMLQKKFKHKYHRR